MVLIVVTLGGLNFFWGEKIPAGGGFGYDGVFYADMVRNLDSMISGGQLSSYYAQRILPAAIVRSMMLFAGVPMNDSNIIHGFELYNLVLLVSACWVWRRVADRYSLSLAGRWMGFSGIFINFQCSKQAFYYPVLTDVTALFIAMLLLLFYVEKKPIALFITTIAGALCWPVVNVCGAFLLFFLRAKLPEKIIVPDPFTVTSKSATVSRLITRGGLVVLAISIVGYTTLILSGPVIDYGFNELRMLLNARLLRRLQELLDSLKGLLTALPTLTGVLVALAMLIGSGAFFKAALAGLNWKRFPLAVLAISAVLIPHGVVAFISNPGLANPSSLKLLFRLAVYPLQEGKFLFPIVSLAVFWGPVVLLLILFWKAFCVEARKMGPGVVAIIGISLLLGLVGEPRFITIAWPFLVLGIVLVFESSTVKGSFKSALIILTVLYAQFWMKLNMAPWLPPDKAGILDFPKQLHFMHYGLWMSWWSYSIQLAAIVLSSMWLHKAVINVGALQKIKNCHYVVENTTASFD
jgi:hypothetical protein